MADILYRFPVYPEHPNQHHQEEETENDKRRQRVNAYSRYFFQIVNEFHNTVFLLVTV